MKSAILILVLCLAAPIFAQLGKGGYNQAALAGAQRSPVNVGRQATKSLPQVQQVQQKTDEEEDESALLGLQRQRPKPRPPPQPAPAPYVPPPQPAPRPAPRPIAPPPQPKPQVLAPVRPRPPAPVPIEAEEANPAPEPYSFSYAVNDQESGATLQREESQDANGNVVGFYHITDAEGRLRRVEYTAGPEGFKATIKSNEEGLEARDPADAHYEIQSGGPGSRAAAGKKPY